MQMIKWLYESYKQNKMWRRCPHPKLEGIYGDAINYAGGRRLWCRRCGRVLDGPVSLAREHA